MARWRDQFTELTQTRYGVLVAYALLLTGNRDDARSLVHETVAQVFGKAPRFSSIGDAEAAVKRAIAAVYVDGKRRGGGGAGADATVAGRDPVHAALMTLSPLERACIVLQYYNDLALADIARALGISKGSAQKYLSDARAKLSPDLGEIAEPGVTLVAVQTGRKS